jgi:hypothetical protein
MRRKSIYKPALVSVFFFLFLSINCLKEDDNNDPSDVLLISPANTASDIAPDTPVIWQAASDPDGDDLVYDLYLGTTPVQSSSLVSGLTVTEYYPSLLSSTTYYWKVVALDQNGGSSESQVWSFTTVNNAPRPFSLVYPSDGSTGVNINVYLSWERVTDPDNDLITYDIYLGTAPEASILLVSSHPLNTYDPELEANTTYYWKVVGVDPLGASSESSVWSFTTGEQAK